jgi:hypothetical protein
MFTLTDRKSAETFSSGGQFYVLKRGYSRGRGGKCNWEYGDECTWCWHVYSVVGVESSAIVSCLYVQVKERERRKLKGHEVHNAILEMATHVTAKQSHNAGRWSRAKAHYLCQHLGACNQVHLGERSRAHLDAQTSRVPGGRSFKVV